MLLWLDPCRTSDALTEIQEAANFIAEVGKGLVVDRPRCALCHQLSISYYDINGGAKGILQKLFADQAETNSEGGNAAAGARALNQTPAGRRAGRSRAARKRTRCRRRRWPHTACHSCLQTSWGWSLRPFQVW